VQDSLADLVARAGQRESGMGVQALEAAASRRAADPAGKFGAKRLLLGVCEVEAGTQLRALADGLRPALDAAFGLEPRDLGDQLWAGQVIGRRERRAVCVARPLLGDGREAVRAADDHAPKGARRTAELAGDDGLIVHAAGWYVEPAPRPGRP